jgi:hypothetical protein
LFFSWVTLRTHSDTHLHDRVFALDTRKLGDDGHLDFAFLEVGIATVNNKGTLSDEQHEEPAPATRELSMEKSAGLQIRALVNNETSSRSDER